MELLNDKSQSLVDKKQKICDIMQIFTVLLDKGHENNWVLHGMAPSVYMQQMSLTTEERTKSLIKQDRCNELIAGQSSVCFRATPNIVIFQRFSPGNTYSVTLSVTNITSSSQNLKMIHTKNTWFTLECKDAMHKSKLAPGMSMVCDVKFFPEERRDYKYQAVFAMTTETFTVPILAIGPRPLLDFPDTVEVPRTAVKIPSDKHLLVRNIGDVPAIFSFSTIRPFTVYPQKGVLAEGETIEVTINFLSAKKGCFKENLIVAYETGEIISLNLCGSAEHCVIRLERESIRMKDTYLGLTRSRTFAIHNRSNYVSNFRWVKYKDSRREQLEQETYKRSFEMMKNIEVVRKVDLEHYNICVPLLHELACQRIYADELSCLTEHTFPFRHPNYSLIPLEGEIWPHSSVDVTLLFEPDEAGVVSSTAFLEVTGREERIPLNLRGICIGPLIRLNITCADLGCILLCSNHHYEVICGNNGDIPGTLVHNPRPADFGGKIVVNPVQVKFQPGNYKSFDLCFSSNRTGDFTEKVDFVVKESLEVISLLIKGSVICPTLHFDKQAIDFGVTALGFTTKHEVCLHNSSLVPVTFCLTITQDGTQQALTHEDFARSVTKPSLVGNPKEFSIIPSEGVVGPHSFQRIKILYTPNVIRSSQTALRADMWDSDSEPVTLPITFNSKVASLVLKPSEIFIRFCFINFPYARSITVENKSDVEGYFYLLPQSVTSGSTVMYSFSPHQGYLKPNESKSISLKLVTTALGRETVQLSLFAFGDRSLASCCFLICNGQGPIVTVQPTQLNWGEVRLLTEVKSTITLVNDSPIPAQFVAELHKTLSPWTVSPASGELEPNKSLKLEITIYLRDTGKYSDTVDIEIMNSRVVTCFLTAAGIGSSIVMIPDVIPVFDMGLLFRDQDVSIPITMVNKGTRHHRLTWTTTADLQVFQISGTNEQSDKFVIDPYITELPPDAESVVYCKIRWGINEPVTEQWYLHGLIKGQGKRQILGTSLFKVTFTNPNILFNKRKLTFLYDPGAHETVANPTDALFVTNRSGLDLKARVKVEPPFEMIAENENDIEIQKVTTILLRNDVRTGICVRFNTQAIDTSNLYSQTFRKALTFDYETHCAKDKIECVGEVIYPNISLSPMEPVILSCEVGSTVRTSLTLVNTGHLPVRYSFEWLDEFKIPTTTRIAPYLQTHESSIIHEKEEADGDEEQGGESEETKVANTTGYLFAREPPEILSATRSERSALSASATSHNVSAAAQLVTTYGDNAYPEINLTKITTSTEKKKPSSVGSSPRRLSISVDMDNGESSSLSSLFQIAMHGIRDFISPMVDRYYIEDTEIPAIKHLQDPATDELQHCRESTTTMLDVVPRKGVVLPHSSQYVYFELDATQRIEIDAKIACRVEHGPTETINVRANADAIRYSIDEKFIHFGRQLFGELCRKTLTIVNRGTVGFTFETNVLPMQMRNCMKQKEETADVAHLRMEPGCGVVNPMSKMCLDIIYYVGILGPIREEFDLEIANRAPISIRVQGYGSLPQAYLTIPRLEAFKRLPVKVCYEAIGNLTAEFLAEVRRFGMNNDRITSTVDDNAQIYLHIPELEREHLTVGGWEVISLDELLPTVMDVEMAVERLLTIEHIRENPYILAKHNSAIKKRGIPSLFVPEYTIDMGYVVIDRVGYYSAMLINYGPAPTDVHIKKERSKRTTPVKEPGIVVHLRNRKCLPVGEPTPLNVTFHPTRSLYTEKRTDVEQTFYLEVTHGATMPISVRAVATYPVLTAHVSHLSFEDVAVGNCMLMPILLRNELIILPIRICFSGWVPCEWQATIRCEDGCRSKQQIGPFFLHYSSDIFLPGYESVINIYFKPKEAKRSTGQLRIKIADSIFPILVSMSGTGTEPELQIFDNTLAYETVVPYIQPQEKTLLVKNVSSHPVEVFWRNFDTSFIEEERMIRILMHYYGVDEILLPPRCPGDKLSPRVYDFYQTLSEEMVTLFEARKSGSDRNADQIRLHEEEGGWWQGERADVDKEQDEEVGRIYTESEITPSQPSVKKEMALLQPLNGWISQSIGHDSTSCEQIIKEFSELKIQDSNQIEALLHCYIDELQQKEDFSETMKDPVKEIFEDAEPKFPLIDHSSQPSGPCIIFHGAPFTTYQQVACRVGNMIGVSVLNINNAITEIIALGNSACSNELREVIDKNYNELLLNSETNYRKQIEEKLNLGGFELDFGDVIPLKNPGEKARDSNASSRRIYRTVSTSDAGYTYVANPESTATVCNEQSAEDSHKLMEPVLKISEGSVALKDFQKIPLPDELKSMDPLDEYGYKIRILVLVEKIMKSAKNVDEMDPGRDVGNGKTSRRTISSARTKKLDTEKTFLGIHSDLIHEALKQRLAMHDFQAGFTVQTMDNIFIKDERDTLVMLLNIVGDVRFLRFVTFHNTLNMYLTQNDKLVMAEEMKATEELEKKLLTIAEMTRSEYDQISEDEKTLYASNTLALKRADSDRRHLIYNQRLAEAILNRKSPLSTKRASIAAPIYGSKISKGKTTQLQTVKSLPASSDEFQPSKAKQSTPMNDRTNEAMKTENAIKAHRLSADLEEISKLMGTYRTSLANLQHVLTSWDSRKSTYNETVTKKKTPKSGRDSDTLQQTAGSKGIDVWYVAPVDPWNSDIYDKVASYLAETDDIKSFLPSNGHSKPINLDCKLYSVAGGKSIIPSNLATQSGAYTLTSVTDVTVAGFHSPMDPAGVLTPVIEIPNNLGLEEPTSITASPQFRQGSVIAAAVVEEPLKPRWIMQPNETCKFKVHFTPKSVGNYKDEYDLSVAGTNITRRIAINGSADIPRLNMAPDNIFSNVEEAKLDDLNKPTYFLDTKTYDFGCIPLAKNEGKTLYHRRVANFVFSNTSTMPLTVSFFRMDNSSVYSIAPDILNIGPGKSDILNVTAEVSKAGPNSERLLLCVRDNPQVEIIQLRSCGSKLEVELKGKVVEFEKILLWRKAKRTVVVKNKSSVPLYWGLDLGENGIDTQITLHPVRGFLGPLEANHIECNYSAESVGILERTIITFHAYLGEHDTEPLLTDFITITGESYDVKVDLTHANPIDLKRVKVGLPATETFTIRNRGPYDMGFIIQPGSLASLNKPKSHFPPNLIKDFKLEPGSGSLSPEESVIIVVNFLPRDEVAVIGAPLFKCILVDKRNTPSTVAAELPLFVSVSAHCAKVKIQPHLGLNFGHMPTFDKRTMYFDIENVGFFSFRYKISSAATSNISPDAPPILGRTVFRNERPAKIDKAEGLTSETGTMAQSNKNRKTPPNTKAALSGGDETNFGLKVGPFVLSRYEGKVEAGEVETIAVQCCPESVTLSEREVQVFVSDTDTSGRNAEPVKLSVNGCIPTIDFRDLDAIFQENLIVDSIDDFACPRELGPHSIYGRREKCLYFRRVGLSRTYTARFKLHNPGFVNSDVTIKLEPVPNNPLHGDGGTDAFSIKPQKARISPLSTEIFSISFSPKLLGSYVAAFSIVHELPPPLKSQWIRINICGEGAVPEVVLLEPTTPYTNDQILMNFGRTLVDEVAHRLMTLKNVGSVEAKVIAKIRGDANSFFTFETADQDTERLSATWRWDSVEDKRRVVRYLMPEEIACVNIRFAPNEVGKYESRVDVFTVDNPYENVALVVLGESYDEDVILEGLGLLENILPTSFTGKGPSRSRKGSRDSQLKSLLTTSAESITSITKYKINYGSCFLNESKRICFKITNKSKQHSFRFAWSSHPNIVFSPSVGHLNSHGSKDIVATFSALAPVTYTETELECRVNELSRLAGGMNDICWDDRQINIRWDAGESGYLQELGEEIVSRDEIYANVAEPITEPANRYDVLGSTKIIQVILCATAAYSQYDCPIREINFKDVLMFQSCKYTFVLSNPGVVDMAYKWNLRTNAQYSTRLSNSALREVLCSLDNPCPDRTRPKLRTLGGTLQTTDLDNRKFSIIASPAADKVEDAELRRCNAGNASGLSNSTAVSNRSSAVSLAEGQYRPFEIIPEEGVLLPGKSVECALVFSPLDVFDYRAYLTCRIENLDPELPPLMVTVTARSLLPYCHFEIPESDFSSSRKRDAAPLGLLGNETDDEVGAVKLVQIQVIGIGQMHVKKFCMINPTMEDYHFSWRESKVRCVEEISYFDCVVAEGVAERGKRTEFIFKFLAKDVGVFESLWIFSIERYKLETTFLFVATVTEPSVYAIPVHLKIKPTVMGTTSRASLSICNRESIELPFRIMPKSLYSDDRLQRLIVEPMFGTLQPNSEERLEVKFRPAFPGESEFSMHCRIDKLRNPLVAIISTTTYSIEPQVKYKKSDGEDQQFHRNENNIIECGIMQFNKPFVLNIHIANVGESAFRYTWDLCHAGKGDGEDKDCEGEWVEFGGFKANVPRQGHVTSQSSITCPLTVIAARRTAAMLDRHVTLKIHRGPEYQIQLKGIMKHPSYLLNFNTYDFGPSYIHSSNVCHYSAKIHFTNKEETPCTLECESESLPYLLVDHERVTGVVQGLSSVSISVKFIPLARVCYRGTIRLLINSVNEENITILGEGIEYKVYLSDLHQKLVDLGSVRTGKSVTRQVPLINKGRAPILLKIGLVKELPAYNEIYSELEGCDNRRDRDGKREQSLSVVEFSDQTRIPSIQEAEMSKVVLKIEPSDPIVLHPNEKLDVFVTYSPVQRIRIFEEIVGCQVHETILTLFSLKGACIGAEFFLDKTFLSFGTVVEGSSRDLKIVLTNTGDIGGRFTWDVEKLMPHYNLVPQTGYCSPGMDVSFIVTFSPMCRSSSILGQTIVDIKNYQTMSLTMSGACESFPEPTATVYLSTRVRQPTSAEIIVTNTSSETTWTLEPVIYGDYFTATEVFTVLPLKSNACTVTYKPLSMTAVDHIHRGTIFFKLPEGRGLLYVLDGTSLPPEPVAKILREFSARTRYTELLPVSNWLKKTQRFSCFIELLDDIKGNPVYNFQGNKTIDVPSEAQRDYRAIFNIYKEGNFHFRITFKNDEGEFHYYELHYKVMKPGIVDTINLTATVRTVACHLLKLENPLQSEPVTYTIESPHPYLTISESSRLVNPESTENVKIEFYPMIPLECTVKLDASCVDLGTFSYLLNLKGITALPEKLISTSAMLGNYTIFPITIKNHWKQAASFSIMIDDPSFFCARNISIQGFGEADVSVTYEPCELQNVSATLTASSQVAGEYRFPINGIVISPKPQGPFAVTLDRALQIPFKNIFNGTKTFNFHIDAPETFRIEHHSETILSKKTVKIAVGLCSPNDSKDEWDIGTPIAARLIVYPTEPALSRIKWIYYLRGVFES